MDFRSKSVKIKSFKQLKCIYWVFEYNGWRLSEHWLLQPKRESKKFDFVWWNDCRRYEK